MTRRQRIYNKYNGLCAYTGKPLGEDWQIDHITPQRVGVDNDEANLLPAIKIINHYKRAQSIEAFRHSIKTLHLRLAKLPKKTSRPETVSRIKYLNEVAELFGVKVDKPFEGKFYFETVNTK